MSEYRYHDKPPVNSAGCGHTDSGFSECDAVLLADVADAGRCALPAGDAPSVEPLGVRGRRGPARAGASRRESARVGARGGGGPRRVPAGHADADDAHDDAHADDDGDGRCRRDRCGGAAVRWRYCGRGRPSIFMPGLMPLAENQPLLISSA